MEGWKIKPLGDVCEFQRGLTYGKSDEVDMSSNVVLRANNVDLATHSLDLSELRYISDSIAVPADKKLRKGSLLICTASGSKSHLGKVAYVDDDYGYAFGGFMGQITPVSGLDGRYLFHVLTSPAYKDFIEALSDGVNINNLKFDDLRQFSVPVPPLPEQRRIVAILDEAFDAIATAKANTARSAVLCADSHAAARSAAFSTIAAEIPRIRLADAVDRLTNGYVGPVRGVYVDEGVPYLLARHVRDNRLQFDGKTFLTDEFNLKHKKSMLKTGDLLLVQSGHIGHCAVVGPEHTGHNCHAMIVITPRPGLLLGGYLAEFFYTGEMLRKFESIRSGSTVPHLTCGEVREIGVPVPAVEVQSQLLRRLSDVAAARSRLEAALTRKLTALDELKKSLLHQAFTGQLTAKATDQQVAEVA
jgi:type I restriction enzyme, S subunit